MTDPGRDNIDPTRLENALRQKRLPLGLPLLFLEETSSTNDIAAAQALRGAEHGALVIAERQTSGRGRLGRKWFSPGGQNLYFSLVLRPKAPLNQVPAITLAVGLGVAEAVATFVSDVDVKVRWPNDVLLANRKAVGILVEASLDGLKLRHVIAGIGIDVLQTEFDPEIASIATSIAQHSKRVPARTDVLLVVLERLALRLGQFEEQGLSGMIDQLRARDACLGRRLRCVEGEGVGEGIEVEGTLRVRLDTGASVSVRAGEIVLLD